MTKDEPDPTPDPTPDAGDETVEDPEDSSTVKVGEHEYVILAAARDDFELMDDLEEMSRTGDPSRTPSILRRLLGRTQARIALERLRDEETGRVPIDAGSDFVLELLNGLDPN